jgi:hypothetical protein
MAPQVIALGPAALCPDLTAHSLDQAVEQFDFPDSCLTLMPDLVPQHAVLAPEILNMGLEAGDLGISSTCGWRHGV